MKSPTMLYKPGVKYTSNDGVKYDTLVVDGSEVEETIKGGKWFKHYRDFPDVSPPKKKAAVKKVAKKKAAK